ncbi:MAG: DUF4058 family protein [Blastocatellia bacterium]
MALRDHFHPPLSVWRHWHSFHNGWASNIAADLNSLLPDRWFAEPNVQFGIEIDVATFDRLTPSGPSACESYTPPAPTFSMPFEPMAEAVEINIFNSEAGPTLVGAVELISPGNKDRTAQREAFVTKCENYLLAGIGLVIVDIVTDRLANLHNELMARLGQEVRLETRFYATAYRLVEVNHQPRLDIWTESLAIGHQLPVMPLWLRGDTCFPVDLERTYEKTCAGLKIEPDAILEPRQAIG